MRPSVQPCYHDGKGVHVRVSRMSPVVVVFRRPFALTDSVWARCDFNDVFSPCDEHLTPEPVL